MSAAGAETKRCPNCRQDVSVDVYATMHEPRCRRLNRFCERCNEPIKVADFDRHVAEDHKQISCPDCDDRMEGWQLDDHQEEECRKRLVTCKYCELDWQCDELPEHSSHCGSRTDECSLCHTRVRLSDMEWHMTEKHGVPTSHSSASAASSSLPSTGKQSANGSSKPSSTHCSASQAAAQPPATAAASLKLSGSQPPHAKTTTPPDAEWGVTEVPASASASLAASSTNTTTATQQAKRRVPRSTQQTKSPPAAAAAAGNARGLGAYGSLSGSVTSSSVAAGAANTLSSSQLTGSTSNSSRASAANSRASVTSSTATSNPPLSNTSSSSKKTTTSSSKKTTGSSSSRSTASLSSSSSSVKQASSARSNGARGSTVTPSTSSASMASNSRSGLSRNTPKHNGGSAPFAAAAGPPPQADTQNAVGASSTSYFEGCSSDPNDVPVACEFCEVEVRLGDLDDHELACARREQRCTGCGMSFRGNKLPQHRRTGCSRELQAPAASLNAAAAAGGGGYGTTSFPGLGGLGEDNTASDDAAPCEGCGEQFPLDVLFDHQEGCLIMLSQSSPGTGQKKQGHHVYAGLPGVTTHTTRTSSSAVATPSTSGSSAQGAASSSSSASFAAAHVKKINLRDCEEQRRRRQQLTVQRMHDTQPRELSSYAHTGTNSIFSDIRGPERRHDFAGSSSSDEDEDDDNELGTGRSAATGNRLGAGKQGRSGGFGKGSSRPPGTKAAPAMGSLTSWGNARPPVAGSPASSQLGKPPATTAPPSVYRFSGEPRPAGSSPSRPALSSPPVAGYGTSAYSFSSLPRQDASISSSSHRTNGGGGMATGAGMRQNMLDPQLYRCCHCRQACASESDRSSHEENCAVRALNQKSSSSTALTGGAVETLPCEFCNKQFRFTDLTAHQEQCYDNLNKGTQALSSTDGADKMQAAFAITDYRISSLQRHLDSKSEQLQRERQEQPHDEQQEMAATVAASLSASSPQETPSSSSQQSLARSNHLESIAGARVPCEHCKRPFLMSTIHPHEAGCLAKRVRDADEEESSVMPTQSTPSSSNRPPFARGPPPGLDDAADRFALSMSTPLQSELYRAGQTRSPQQSNLTPLSPSSSGSGASSTSSRFASPFLTPVGGSNLPNTSNHRVTPPPAESFSRASSSSSSAGTPSSDMLQSPSHVRSPLRSYNSQYSSDGASDSFVGLASTRRYHDRPSHQSSHDRYLQRQTSGQPTRPMAGLPAQSLPASSNQRFGPSSTPLLVEQPSLHRPRERIPAQPATISLAANFSNPRPPPAGAAYDYAAAAAAGGGGAARGAAVQPAVFRQSSSTSSSSSSSYPDNQHAASSPHEHGSELTSPDANRQTGQALVFTGRGPGHQALEDQQRKRLTAAPAITSTRAPGTATRSELAVNTRRIQVHQGGPTLPRRNG